MRCVHPPVRSAKLANGREGLPSAGFSDAYGRMVGARNRPPRTAFVARKQREFRQHRGSVVSRNQPGGRGRPREETAMERKHQVASAVRRALVMGALAAAGATPALAQESLGEIVVTGSRIRSANLESTTPVTQVTAADVVTQGVTRIEDLVNQLPQAFAAQNVTVANGATGTATLNLRGLGSPRTLVLIDGRRMPYGGVTSASAAPDINQIPTQMIERVDILTGGASAVYGSDAVAGVVNFIMKKDFEGVQVTSQYNFYWHENDYSGPGSVKLRDTIAGLEAVNPSQYALPDDTVTDGEGKELSLMVGVNSGDGRGNITAYATVFDSDQVLQRDRDYSACSLDT